MSVSIGRAAAAIALSLAVIACGSSARTAFDPPPAANTGVIPATRVTIIPYSTPTGVPAGTTASQPSVPIATSSQPIPPATLSQPPAPTATPSQPPAPMASATPFGCQKPPEDYSLVHVTPDSVLSQRTISMIKHAQELYGGSHVFMKAITQGSYNPGLAASFGTHDGGGAVDLSVRDLANWDHVLTDEFPVILLALREAGFAAWVRQPGELYKGSPLHIHAIAVGDRDLSPAAVRQLTGPEGYFRGFNGLPVDPPAPDLYGPPILCPWMVEMGYSDLRGAP